MESDLFKMLCCLIFTLNLCNLIESKSLDETDIKIIYLNHLLQETD